MSLSTRDIPKAQTVVLRDLDNQVASVVTLPPGAAGDSLVWGGRTFKRGEAEFENEYFEVPSGK